MPRTIISVDQDDKAWLDREAKKEQVAMTEIVRRALRHNRIYREAEAKPNLQQLLKKTQGVWNAGDGLEYQERLRDEWSDKK